MTVVKKVQSKLAGQPQKTVSKGKRSLSDKAVSLDKARQEVGKVKKVCYFCQTKQDPRYWDSGQLRKYLSDRGRIYPRSRTKMCAKHQQRVSKEIKRARHLALLPFTPAIF